MVSITDPGFPRFQGDHYIYHPMGTFVRLKGDVLMIRPGQVKTRTVPEHWDSPAVCSNPLLAEVLILLFHQLCLGPDFCSGAVRTLPSFRSFICLLSKIMPGPVGSVKEAAADKTQCMVLVLEELKVWWRSQAETSPCDHCKLRVTVVCLEVEQKGMESRIGRDPWV